MHTNDDNSVRECAYNRPMDSCGKKIPTPSPARVPPQPEMTVDDDASDTDSISAELNWINSMVKKCPPVSLLDFTARPLSPLDIRDFDSLDPFTDYIRTPEGPLLDMPRMTSDMQQSLP